MIAQTPPMQLAALAKEQRERLLWRHVLLLVAAGTLMLVSLGAVYQELFGSGTGSHNRLPGDRGTWVVAATVVYTASCIVGAYALAAGRGGKALRYFPFILIGSVIAMALIAAGTNVLPDLQTSGGGGGTRNEQLERTASERESAEAHSLALHVLEPERAASLLDRSVKKLTPSSPRLMRARSLYTVAFGDGSRFTLTIWPLGRARPPVVSERGGDRVDGVRPRHARVGQVAARADDEWAVFAQVTGYDDAPKAQAAMQELADEALARLAAATRESDGRATRPEAARTP